MVEEVNNVLRILNEAVKDLEEENFSKLRELSNQTINTASRTQDPDNIAVAVAVYTIGKIFERKQIYAKEKDWNSTSKELINCLKNAIKKMDEKNETKEALIDINGCLNNISSDLQKNIREVLIKAKINKASKIYEHGISLERTAKLLGLTLFDLASYSSSNESSSDAPETLTQDIKFRIKTAENFFK